MSSDQPYNELGQILASGGEIAVGLALYHGWDSARIALLLGRRLRVAPGTDTEQLMAIAQEALSSGEYLNTLEPGDIIDPSKIALNPALFGEDTEGRRWRWEAEYRYGPEGEWWRYGGGEADLTQLGEIAETVAGIAQSNKGTYVAKVGIPGDIEAATPEIRFVLAERRF